MTIVDKWTNVNERPWLESLAKSIDKTIVLHTKAHWFAKVLSWVVLILTAGQVSRERFLKWTATAIANHHFYPERMSASSVERMLPHEGRHTLQLKLFGFWIHPLVGIPIGAVVYGLLPLPFGLAFGRFYMELDADIAEWKAMLKEYNDEAVYDWIRRHAERRAETLSGSLYAWAMIKPIGLWLYKKAAEKVINEYSNLG